MALADAELGDLMFRCPNTGRMFNSGFQTDRADLTAVPRAATIRLRCPICDEPHAVSVSHGSVEQRPRRVINVVG
ncbi:MAG TPA: hypothetical protein VFB45_14000 [Pseudolabrys sp.]|nr:hypothetical protein [Pseudolabrys sp.]